MVTTEIRNDTTPSTTTPAVSATADPAPLGLAAFAAPMLVLSFVNAGALDSSALVATVLPIAMFYGGLIQILAGLLEYRRGNTFGTMAFSTFGAFWLSFAAYSRFFSTNASAAATGMFILVFVIVAAYLTVAAIRVSGVVFAVFAVLTLSFAVLTIASFASSVPVQHIGGWLGVLTAILAFYASAASVVNATWKRPVLPMLTR